ncbi:MAG: MFS transporter, partial [Clostridia bacterium]|nr:MFS transporter [Clostridia bacterium]
MPVSASLSRRRLYLVVGVAAMLFSGVLYAWSILKMPFKELFAWSDSALAFNFTLTMCFFCLGAFFGSLICKRTSPRFALILAGILVGIGFCLTGLLTADGLFLLYITYAVLAASGIGISYNVIVSTVTAWFPDKKGFCSGCLMMGFGFSTLLLGNMIDALFESSVGWSGTYLLLGILLAAVLVIAGLILRRPAADTVFPAAKAGKNVRT